ncbi:hypothetical protein MASR1M12_22210 [Erysipelotrichia bacterium]
MLAGFDELSCQAQPVPGNVGTVIGLAVKNDENFHSVVFLSVACSINMVTLYMSRTQKTATDTMENKSGSLQ